MSKENLKLPEGINESDLKYPSWKSKDRAVSQFELWEVPSFGWVIPTLPIRHASHRSVGHPDRTYAVRVSDAGVVRVGLGPHVTRRLTVHVRNSRLAKLQKYLDLKKKGEADAGMVRDRISTRRAMTALRRTSIW